VPPGAPETYEDFTMPEGMELDTQTLEAFTPIAKELNLTQEQAQKLVSLYADQLNGMQKAQVDAFAEQKNQWVAEIAADPEIGGADNAKNVGIAKKALQMFAGDELSQWLHETGLSDHPAMVRAWYRVGKAIEEDKVRTGEANRQPVSQAHTLYPDLA